MSKFLYINNNKVEFENERNLLEVIRKTNIDLPTFCYHSELSVYGACRLCIVDIEGKGMVSSCSTAPQQGMNVKTHTKDLREIRKISLELFLANHDQSCTTCAKSSACKLQELSNKLGVENVRFKEKEELEPLDTSSDALLRDPNKCILCGDCVRACYEIQGIGAIDFANRGADVAVVPAFNRDLAKVECVDCGQCARVCPTGAITPKTNIDRVWEDIDDPNKTVVAQIAPAVRVAIGEVFGIDSGKILTGQVVAALKMLGFNKVFDTSFGADLTVIEEAEEFLERKQTSHKLPIITSCCPAWVKYAEQYYPEYLENLSSCKSPQQMLGSIAKETLPDSLGIEKENMSMVSIMPCTAKKMEANRPEFNKDGIKEVDHVLTTQELASMIKEAGIRFSDIEPESFDLPYGFKTGAGILFGNSGGVSEAVLRYSYEKLTGSKLFDMEFNDVRGNKGVKEVDANINGNNVRMAVVYGLKNAKQLLEKMKTEEKKYDMIEVMACPGGCIGGAGQPVCYDETCKSSRTKGIYHADKMMQLHKPQENPYLNELYENTLMEPGSEQAHNLLHTKYKNRKRIFDTELRIISGQNSQKLEIKVCVGTNCYIKGSQDLLHRLIHYIDERELNDFVNVNASFCMENCENSCNVSVGDKIIEKADFNKIVQTIENELSSIISDENSVVEETLTN